MGKIYTFNDKIITINNKWCEEYVEPTPPGPSFDEVTIGTQTWMAKNLAIDDGQGGIYSADNVTANGVNMGTQYYYNFDAAVRVANTISGWHLPTKAEWETLISYCGGTDVAGGKLKSTTGWNDSHNGTDNYGFTAYPVGSVSATGSSVSYKGRYTYFRTSTTSGSYATVAYISLAQAYNSIYTADLTLTKHYAVRLIKDT